MALLRNSSRLELKDAFAVAFIATAFAQVLVVSQYIVEMDKAMHDKALVGFGFRNLTRKNVAECFLACVEDCLCVAFQVYREGKCQLLSNNRFQTSLVTLLGYSYYDMMHEIKGKQCNGEGWKCKNPCQHNASHEIIIPQNRTAARFKCNCLPGYTGKLCEYGVKSCRGYINDSRVPGKYKVMDDHMHVFEVYCDFDLTSRKAWTLFQSYEFQHRAKFSDKPLSTDWPVFSDTPRWDEYRLSKSRMLSIQKDSQKWRFTCNYSSKGVIYQDYIQGNNDKINIMTYSGKTCRMLELINIRGQNCTNCTVYLIQGVNARYALHIDSYYSGASKNCDFQPKESKSCGASGGEDNFGLYNCVNTNHRCSSSNLATTQGWFGGN